MKTLELQLKLAKQNLGYILLGADIVMNTGYALTEDDIQTIREAEEEIKELETRAAKF